MASENVEAYHLRMKVAPGLFDASERKMDHSGIAPEWSSLGIVKQAYDQKQASQKHRERHD